jgi:hypothetical protein
MEGIVRIARRAVIVGLIFGALLVAASGAQASATCHVDPFAYNIVGSRYDGHIGAYGYQAFGTTTLTGSACGHLAGHPIGIAEHVIFGRGFGFIHVVSGDYEAQIDLDHDGFFDDAAAHGRVVAFDAGFGVFEQLVDAQTTAGGTFTLHQTAFVDLGSPFGPLLFLEATSGTITIP